MMRKVILVVMALMFSLNVIGLAYAGQNLKAESVKGLYGAYKDGAITLNWNTNIVDESNNPLTVATNIIRIYRGEARDQENEEIGYKDVEQEVNNADLGTNMQKVIAFSFTDSNVEKGKTYYYKVTCGSMGYKWARTSVTAEDPAAVADNKRKQYEEQSDWPERMAGSLLVAIPKFFMYMFNLYDPLELIFQNQVPKPDNLKQGDYTLKDPPIAQVSGGQAVRGEFERVGNNIVGAARNVVAVICILFVVLAGIVIVGAYNDPNKVMLAKKILAGLVICLFMVFAAEKIAGTSLGIIGYTPTSTVSVSPNSSSTDGAFLHTFTAQEFGALSDYYNKLNDSVPVSLVVVIVLMGMGALYTSANPNAKISFREYAAGLFLGLAVLKFGIYVLSVLFDINYAMVKFFEWIVGDKLSGDFLSTLINTDTMSLGQAILTFVSVFSIGVINWQYVVRKLVIALFIGLLPVVAVIAMVPSRRSALDYWFKELISQIFLQTAHAAVLSFGIMLVQETQAQGGDFWLSLACIMGLPSIAVIVRRALGAESLGSGGALGAMGAMMGIGSLLTLGKILAPKIPNKIPGKEALSGVVDSVAGGTGGGANNPAMSMMGKVAGFGFKTAATLSGAAAGGILSGALTGNPAAGAGAGALFGSAMGGGITEIAGKAGDILKMSPDERAQAMGVADPAMLDDPGVAYAAGKRLFGNGMLGKTVSASYAGVKAAQGYFGLTDPGAASQVKNSIANTQRSLSNARTQLAEYKPVYDEAKANYTYAKNMYSPKSSHMQELQQKADSLEIEKNIKENDYVTAYDYFENNFDPSDVSWNPDAAVAMTRVTETESAYRKAKEKLSSAQIELTMGNAIHECSGRRLETAETEYAKRQATVSGLEQRLTTEGIRKEFEKLRQPQVNPNTEIAWR
ncbi:MAG: hypothetical protein A4E53_00818 [Pelotomaculum sp. PtaB.Bin104]|nr:MAG: hypothetical protein A4E53_00818 [Pelotomaculum sp. PtaB.Bin104]